MMMFDEGEYYYSPTEVFSSCLNSFSSSNNSSTKKSKMMNKRRFSDEQVRSLESIFENETKLEPKKKVQVAKELGLQPRQVAIWFQNKRARYKSKQLERDYNLLRANYNALASQFENLKKEKHSLFLQLKKLKEEMGGNKQEESRSLKGDEEEAKSEKQDRAEHIKDNQKIISEEWEAKPAMSMEGSEYGASILSSSDEGSSENYANNYYFGMERGETENMDEMLTSIMEPSTEEGNRWDDYPPPPEPDTLFDDKQAVESCGHWWDFWS